MTCPKCQAGNRDGALFCAKCGEALEPSHDQPSFPTMRGMQPDAQPRYRLAYGKNPFTAVFLAFFPTLGTLYNGDYKKVVTLWVIAGVLLFLAFTGIGLLIASPIALALYVWSIFDAYKVAKRESPRW